MPRQFLFCMLPFCPRKRKKTLSVLAEMSEGGGETLHEYRLPILLAANPEMDDDTSPPPNTPFPQKKKEKEKKALEGSFRSLGSCRRSHPGREEECSPDYRQVGGGGMIHLVLLGEIRCANAVSPGDNNSKRALHILYVHGNAFSLSAYMRECPGKEEEK